jgi:hypothetical protein
MAKIIVLDSFMSLDSIPFGMENHSYRKLPQKMERVFTTVEEFKLAFLEGFDSVFPLRNENFTTTPKGFVTNDELRIDFNTFKTKALQALEDGGFESVVGLDPDCQGVCAIDCEISLMVDEKLIFKSDLPFYRCYDLYVNDYGHLAITTTDEYENTVVNEYLFSLRNTKVIYRG